MGNLFWNRHWVFLPVDINQIAMKKYVCEFMSIDPSLRATGVVTGSIYLEDGEPVIEPQVAKLIVTELDKTKKVRAVSDVISRARFIIENIQSIIEITKPTVVFAETPTGSQSAAAMKSYGMMCAVIGSINPPPIEVTPNEVKVAAVGSKTASKREMIDWAAGKYPVINWYYHGGRLQNKNEHIADAIGAAEAGIKGTQFRQMLPFISSVGNKN